MISLSRGRKSTKMALKSRWTADWHENLVGCQESEDSEMIDKAFTESNLKNENTSENQNIDFLSTQCHFVLALLAGRPIFSSLFVSRTRF
jgi:hypothetical protein